MDSSGITMYIFHAAWYCRVFSGVSVFRIVFYDLRIFETVFGRSTLHRYEWYTAGNPTVSFSVADPDLDPFASVSF